MTGIELNLSPPMASLNFAGNLGGFLQVADVDSRLTTSQLSVSCPTVMNPPQISIFEKKPLWKTKRYKLTLFILTTSDL